MGRPLNEKWFGSSVLPGNQIVVNGIKWADGSTSTDGYIVKQKSTSAYVVSDGVKTEECFMVNALVLGSLAKGQCFILATPFGGVASPCYKIEQFRLSVFNLDGSITSYSWSTIPATKAGEADLIV